MVLYCKSNGCRKTFKFRMDRKRHLHSHQCKGTPPVPERKIIMKDGDNFLCMDCGQKIKHQNNVSRHKKLCKKSKKKRNLFVKPAHWNLISNLSTSIMLKLTLANTLVTTAMSNSGEKTFIKNIFRIAQQ